MSIVRKTIAWFATLALAYTPALAQRIELEVLTDRSSPPAAAQEWMQALGNVKVDRLRFRQDQAQPRPSVHSDDRAGLITYHVTGVIVGGTKLQLPGAQFSKFDVDRLNAYLADLPRQQQAAAAPHAFGMTAAQLVYVRDALKGAVTKPTSQQSLVKFLKDMSRQLPIPLTLAALPAGSVVTEELVGLSSGTALAVALRPQGLVLVPLSTGGQAADVRVTVRNVRDADAHWPVGWPRQQRPNDLAPKLYEFLEVEINDVPLSEAITAIQTRLQLPLLFDQNGMARQDIDPNTARVSFPARRTFYKKMLSNLLFQAKLKSELRVDEAGQPFLWISPIREN